MDNQTAEPKKRKASPKSEAASARIAYGIVLACAALLVIFVGGRVVYALFYVCVLLLPLSLLHALFISRGVWFGQRLEPSALRKGQRASWAFAVLNRSVLPAPWVEILPRACPGWETAPEPERLALLPGGKKEKSVPVRFRYRGLFQVGLDKIVVRDAMRLFAFTVAMDERVEALVYPRIYKLRRFAVSRMNEQERPRATAQASDEALAETRKYIPGDTLSRVHWNLTARNQELTTRLFAQESELRVLCLVDLRPFEAPDARQCGDAVIEAALAAARFVLGRGMPLTFAGFDLGKPYAWEARDLSRFDELCRVCAALSFDTELPPELLLKELPDTRYIMLFTAHNPSDELLRRIPGDVYLDVFRVRRDAEEALPSYSMAGTMRLFALDADERLQAQMEGVE